MRPSKSVDIANVIQFCCPARLMRRINLSRPESGKCGQIQECAAMRIHNVYEDANGESHFRDIEVDW